MRRVVVAGALANRPGNSGGASVRMNWVRGLARLGFEVLFVEQIAASASAADSAVGVEVRRASAWFKRVTDRFGTGCSGALLFGGRSHAVVEQFADSADLLVNLGGHLRDPELLGRFRKRVYVDLDPGFTQIWQEQAPGCLGLEHHDFHFTVGENVGRPECLIPTGGINWQPVRQPVVLADVAVEADQGARTFTTVGAWRGPFGPPEHGGRTYGLKVHEFRKLLPLPGLVRAEFRPALKFHPEDEPDRTRLVESGWDVVDPQDEIRDLDAYHGFIRDSGAECSAAQGIYVDTGSGWFSDRSAQYLAAGKPVLVQETGFSGHLPVGLGLLSFRSLEEAASGVEQVLSRYAAHRLAARAIAEEHFDSDKVLSRMLEGCGIEPPPRQARAISARRLHAGGVV